MPCTLKPGFGLAMPIATLRAMPGLMKVGRGLTLAAWVAGVTVAGLAGHTRFTDNAGRGLNGLRPVFVPKFSSSSFYFVFFIIDPGRRLNLRRAHPPGHLRHLGMAHLKVICHVWMLQLALIRLI